MQTIQTLIRLAVGAALSTALTGCLTSTPHWDATFGDSVTQIRAMQTLNPDASSNTDPVAGIDGNAASAAQKSYAKSFTAPAPTVNTFTIGVGANPN